MFFFLLDALLAARLDSLGGCFTRRSETLPTRAAEPQSTMPCNHVTSRLGKFGLLTTGKKKKGMWKGIWNTIQ